MSDIADQDNRNSKRKILSSWRFIGSLLNNLLSILLFLVFLFFLFLGIYKFLWPPNKKMHIAHFADHIVNLEPSGDAKTIWWIHGQLQTKAPGLLAGEPIKIYAVMWVDPEVFREWNNFLKSAGHIKIEGSEPPEFYGKDISSQKTFDSTFNRYGYVDVQSDTVQGVFILKGDVVFTGESEIIFGTPLKELLELYKTKMNSLGVKVAPRFVKYQIDTSLRMELFANIGISISFLGIFLAHKKRKGKFLEA